MDHVEFGAEFRGKPSRLVGKKTFCTLSVLNIDPVGLFFSPNPNQTKNLETMAATTNFATGLSFNEDGTQFVLPKFSGPSSKFYQETGRVNFLDKKQDEAKFKSNIILDLMDLDPERLFVDTNTYAGKGNASSLTYANLYYVDPEDERRKNLYVVFSDFRRPAFGGIKANTMFQDVSGKVANYTLSLAFNKPYTDPAVEPYFPRLQAAMARIANQFGANQQKLLKKSTSTPLQYLYESSFKCPIKFPKTEEQIANYGPSFLGVINVAGQIKHREILESERKPGGKDVRTHVSSAIFDNIQFSRVVDGHVRRFPGDSYGSHNMESLVPSNSEVRIMQHWKKVSIGSFGFSFKPVVEDVSHRIRSIGLDTSSHSYLTSCLGQAPEDASGPPAVPRLEDDDDDDGDDTPVAVAAQQPVERATFEATTDDGNTSSGEPQDDDGDAGDDDAGVIVQRRVTRRKKTQRG